MKRLSICISVAALMSVAASTVHSQTPMPDSLTVEAAVQLVLSNNPAVQQAVHTVNASEAGVEENRSSFYPSANAEVLYTRLEPVPALSFPGLGSFQLYPANNYDGHIGLRQIVYDFGRRTESVNLARSRVESAKDRLETVKRDLTFRTVQVFYAILFLQRSIQVQDEEIRTLNEHILVTKKKVAAGSATDFDVLTTQVRLAAADNQKINSENTLQNTEVEFRRLTGLSPGSQIRLGGEFTLRPLELNSDALIALAVNQRIEVKTANDALKSADMQYRIASASDNPSLSVSVAYGLKNGFFPNLDVLRGNFVAGLQVEVPIFNGYRTSSQEEEADANIHAAQAHIRDVEEQVRSEVQRSMADVHSATAKLQTTEITVQQAKTALALAKVRYDAGTVTNLDLLDAESALSQAELMRLEALYEYVLSRYELQQAVGEKIW